MTAKVTKKQAEAVLDAVAQWLRTKGYGKAVACETCAGCKGEMRAKYPDAPELFCDAPTIVNPPTGYAAHKHGLGPELAMEFDWFGGSPCPAIVFEGGPYDWSIECSSYVQQRCPGVFVEPMTSWALGIYKP